MTSSIRCSQSGFCMGFVPNLSHGPFLEKGPVNHCNPIPDFRGLEIVDHVKFEDLCTRNIYIEIFYTPQREEILEPLAP